MANINSKRYYLFGADCCYAYDNFGIEKVKEQASKTDVTAYGDVICYNPEIMDISDLLDISSNWSEYSEITESEYNDLAEFWLENYK